MLSAHIVTPDVHSYERCQQTVSTRKVEELRGPREKFYEKEQTKRPTNGHLNFFFPEMNIQSKSSDVQNSQLYARMSDKDHSKPYT